MIDGLVGDQAPAVYFLSFELKIRRQHEKSTEILRRYRSSCRDTILIPNMKKRGA